MIPLRDNIPSRSVPLVNYALIAANVLFFVYELSLPQKALESFLFQEAFVPAAFARALAEAPLDPTRTISPLLLSMFLHGGFAHLLGNMLYLWIFGDNVEDRLGHGRFLLFYLASGAAASIAHFVPNITSTVPTIGASGAVAGVMGAYLILFPRARVVTLIPIFVFIQMVEVPAVLFLVFWFAIQFLQGTLAITETFRGGATGGGVAWWAHVGGFALGALVGMRFRGRARRRVEVLWPH